MTDIPLPEPGDTSWIDWGAEQEDLSDAARSLIPPALKPGYYYQTLPSGTTGALSAHGIGVIRVCPFRVPTHTTLSRIGLEVTTAGDAGSTVRVVIYGDNGAGTPGELVLDAGTVPGDAAGVHEIPISLTLAPGTYYAGGVIQGVTTAQPTVRGYSSSSGVVVPHSALTTGATPAAGAVPAFAWSMSMSGTSGAAAPVTFAANPGPSTSAVRIFVKVA